MILIMAERHIPQTTDSGLTWTRQASAAYDFSSFVDIVQFFDANNGVVIGDPDELGYFEIYTTPNAGASWTRVPLAAMPAPVEGEYGVTTRYERLGNTMWFLSSGTSKRLFKSTDKGVTWTAVAYDAILPGSFSGFTFADQNEGLMYSENAGVVNMYRTIDGGATFTSFPFTGVTDMFSLKCIPGTNTVIASGIPTSFYSNDDGNTWTNIGFPIVSGLKFLNRNTGFADGATISSSEGGIFKYINTISLIGSQIGSPWTTDVNMGTTDGINYTLANQAFSTGEVKFRLNHEWSPGSLDWGSVAFPAGIGVNGGPNIPIPSGTYDVSFNLLTGAYEFDQVLRTANFESETFAVYPNPVDFTLNIRFDKPITGISIYEPNGKIVLEINHPDNGIDVSALSSGLYLMTVAADGELHQTKFVKQ